MVIEKLENKIKENGRIIYQLREEQKSLNEKLDKKIKEDNQAINQLKKEIKTLNEKLKIY